MANSNPQFVSAFPFGRVAILTGSGICLCLYLIYLSYASSAGRFCEIFGTDCSAVVNSGYGSFGGISTASLGLSYFVFHLSLIIGMKRFHAERPEMITAAGFFLSTVGLAFSLYFIFLLKVVLKQGCFACYGVHFINALLFVQNLIRIIRDRHLIAKHRLSAIFFKSESIAAVVFSLLVALNVVFAANFLEARHHLDSERKKLNENLQYYKYLYHTAEYHDFDIVPADEVIGEMGVAIHQIVMFYKDRCNHCSKAKEKLSAVVMENDMAVYLVLKNVKHFTPRQLESIGVVKTPTIFIDGKKAAGWEVPGFLNEFTRDCGC